MMGPMATMTDAERDAFLLEKRLGNLAIGREGTGPLLAPIWYQYTPGGTIDVCMSGSSAKARRLRAEGRASMLVSDERFPYRYVSVEGPVSIDVLGDRTFAAIESMAARYFGAEGGKRYAEQFATEDEIMMHLTPERWRTEVLG